MKIEIIDLDNKPAGEILLKAEIYQQELRQDILHKVVEWQRAKKRAGTHKTKGISEVSGTTKKPYAQKGTGNARQGSLRSPQFRGGAVIFGPVVRDHGYSMQKKIRKLALKIALSSKAAENKLIVMSNLDTPAFKTKDLKQKLENIGINSCLVVGMDSVRDINFARAYKNIKHIDALPTIAINVYDILKHEHLILTRDAVATLDIRLSKETSGSNPLPSTILKENLETLIPVPSSTNSPIKSTSKGFQKNDVILNEEHRSASIKTRESKEIKDGFLNNKEFSFPKERTDKTTEEKEKTTKKKSAAATVDKGSLKPKASSKKVGQ